MGEIIIRKVKGMSWMMKVSLVLIFTLAFSTFMYQGWYKPKKSEAAIAALKDWTNVYSGTTAPGALTYDVPAGTLGASRMLVVAVSSFISTASGAQTCTVTYGGQTMTAVASNFTTSSRFHTALFYLLDAGIQAAGLNNQLVVTLSAQGTQRTAQVDAAVFEGVNQTAPASSSSWLNNGTATAIIGPLSPGLTISTGDLAVEAVAISRTSTTPRTMNTWAAGWSPGLGPTTQTGSASSTNLYIAESTTTGTTTSQHTASGTTWGSMSAMSIDMLPMDLQVGNGTVLGAANAGQGTITNVLDSFTMAASAGGVSVSTLTLTGTNFTATNIAGISVYRDNGTAGGLDGADVLVPTSYAIVNATTITITFTSAELVSASTNYLITADIGAAATLGNTITGRVTAATGVIGTPTYNDTSSATLTITSAPGLTVGNGTNPADGPAGLGTQNNALDGFTLQTVNANGGTAAIDTLTITGSANFTAANVTDVHVFADNGTAGVFDAGDVLAPSTATAIAGNATTLTFSPPLYVTNTAQNYLVVVDIASGATVGQTFTGTVTAATGHGLATPTYSDSTSATLTIKQYASKITSCGQCHAYPPSDGTRAGATGAVVGDHQKHKYICSTCHVAPATESPADFGHRNGNIQMQANISGGTYGGGTVIPQVNSPKTTYSCSNISCHGGNNPTPVWGVGTAGCVDCHNGTITRTKGVPGGTLDNVVAEFNQTWGHRNVARTAANGGVTNADCIVCHLEGNYTTQATSSYHADGNIDLRDPDGAGETPITNNSGGAFTFTKFSMDFTTRTTAVSNSVADVITQKFCLACHDSDGAVNTAARSNNGGTGTAAMPFGGIALGANYTAANGAIGTQGLIDVKTELATTNSSYHPVLGPLNRDYPYSTRLAAPYNNIGTTRDSNTGTLHTKALSVVINCFDCHNASASLKTNRTIVAHGGAETLRGTIYVSSPTLCLACHIGYSSAPGSSTSHGAGSAGQWNGNSGEAATTNCAYCHSSAGINTEPARPIPAQDYHGFNSLVGGGLWPTVNSRPYAFIRSWTGTAYHRPYRSSEFTTGTATCGAGTCPGNGNVGDGSTRTYTPGGSY